MAVVLYVTCPICGKARPPHMVGLPSEKHAPQPLPELSVVENEIGGYGRSTWSAPYDMPLPMALALRARLQAALEQLDSQIAAVAE